MCYARLGPSSVLVRVLIKTGKSLRRQRTPLGSFSATTIDINPQSLQVQSSCFVGGALPFLDPAEASPDAPSRAPATDGHFLCCPDIREAGDAAPFQPHEYRGFVASLREATTMFREARRGMSRSARACQKAKRNSVLLEDVHNQTRELMAGKDADGNPSYKLKPITSPYEACAHLGVESASLAALAPPLLLSRRYSVETTPQPSLTPGVRCVGAVRTHGPESVIYCFLTSMACTAFIVEPSLGRRHEVLVQFLCDGEWFACGLSPAVGDQMTRRRH